MAAAKLLLLTAILAVMSTTVMSISTALLRSIVTGIQTEHWGIQPTDEGYHFKQTEPNGYTREEMGIVLNRGTEKQELVIMGMYSHYDMKSGVETITMYTADKNGYKQKFAVKHRPISKKGLQSAAG